MNKERLHTQNDSLKKRSSQEEQKRDSIKRFSGYRKIEDKKEGQEEGLIAIRNSNGLKSVLKMPTSTQKRESSGEQKNELISEFVAGAIYKEILGDCAPEIRIALESAQKKLYIDSRWIEGFEELEKTKIDFSKLKGLEIALFSSLLLGDKDIHLSNVGVIISDDQEKNGTICKIDHGKAFRNFYEDSNSLLLELSKSFQAHYETHFNLNFNINNCIEAIEKIKKVSIEKINEEIFHKIFSVKNNTQLELNTNQKFALYRYKNGNKKFLETHIENYEKLTEHYINVFKNNISHLDSLSNTLKAISKIDGGEYFKNRKWIIEVAEKDPIAWAIKNNKTIENQNPIIWALKENIKIEDKNPITWARINNSKIENEDPVTWWAKHRAKAIEEEYKKKLKKQESFLTKVEDLGIKIPFRKKSTNRKLK